MKVEFPWNVQIDQIVLRSVEIAAIAIGFLKDNALPDTRLKCAISKFAENKQYCDSDI